jgi:signal transduction histidine kinase
MQISSQMQPIREHSFRRGGLLSVIARWLLLLALAVGLAAGGAALALHVSRDDLMQITLYLLISGVASVLLGLAALLVLRSWPWGNLRLKLALPPLVAALVISVNVYVTAQMMFIAPGDAAMLLLLLAFGFMLSLGLASAVADALLSKIRALEAGARQIARGDYGARLPSGPVGERDELGQLGSNFNLMAARVQESFERQRETEQSQRHFIAATSHDLRTPLTSIRAMIEAMDDGVVTDPATIARYIHTIRGEAQHLSALIDDLFELSRLDAGVLELRRDLASLDDLVSDSLEAMRAAADQKGVALIGRVERDLPLVRVDVPRIQRVLFNLLQNAIRHTPGGGSVLIRVSALNTDHNQTQQRGVLVEVMDSGQGIRASDLPHIFERFYRGEPSRSREPDQHNAAHAGLGLTIARALVDKHGGQISAHSPCTGWPADLPQPTTGPGSTFTFTLPAS